LVSVIPGVAVMRCVPVQLVVYDCEGELDADIVNDMVSVSSSVAVMLCVAEVEYVPVVDTV
jgi:hypothetical protein